MDIILNGEKLDAFPLRLGKSKDLSLFLFNKHHTDRVNAI